METGKKEVTEVLKEFLSSIYQLSCEEDVVFNLERAESFSSKESLFCQIWKAFLLSEDRITGLMPYTPDER